MALLLHGGGTYFTPGAEIEACPCRTQPAFICCVVTLPTNQDFIRKESDSATESEQCTMAASRKQC